MPRCAFVTLGCKVNQYDTQAIREDLARRGYREVPASAEADVYLVNTCCVTRESHGKGLQAIRRIARSHPGAAIVVTGCSAETDAEAIRAIPGVACVVGNEGKARIAETLGECGIESGTAVATEWPSISTFAGHTRAFVKIEDGCDACCSYCIVPRVRGPVRSRPPDEVVAEVERLVGNGYLEIVLSGIHLGAYGQERGNAWGLVGLLERVLTVAGLRRLRLSSLELAEVSDRLLDLMAASPVVCPHLHIPLQSGDDGVLAAMNRRYTAGEFLAHLEAIRSRIEEPAVTTDIIVGFPGETDGQFRTTVEVARRAAFSRIHIFPYSDRPGTAAERMAGKVPWPTIKARREAMRAVASELMAAYHRRFIGRPVEPLVETERDHRTGLLTGYTERYVRAEFDGSDGLRGRIVAVRVTGATKSGVRAGNA